MEEVIRVVKKECNGLGLPTYLELSDGSWERMAYDEVGRKVLSVSSDGWTERYDYFDGGSYVMARCHQDGRWLNCSFNPDGELVYSLDSEGFWVRYTYDESGKAVFYEDSSGESEWF